MSSLSAIDGSLQHLREEAQEGLYDIQTNDYHSTMVIGQWLMVILFYTFVVNAY